MRASFRTIQLLTVICASAPASCQQGGIPARDPGRDTDVRAIYSWVINHSAGDDKIILIAPQTNASEYPEQRCLAVPPDHTRDFRELRADFDRRKNTVGQVPKMLSTSKPHVILDPDLANQAIWYSARLSESPLIRERYPGVQHLLIFSEIYFNRKRTVALVEVDSWCGGLCGTSRWTALEKGRDGTWEMRPWVPGCIAVAERRNSSEFLRVAVSGSFFTRIGIGGIPFLLPLLYQVGLGASPVQSGLLMMPQAIAAMSLKMTMPKILARFGYRAVLVRHAGALSDVTR